MIKFIIGIILIFIFSTESKNGFIVCINIGYINVPHPIVKFTFWSATNFIISDFSFSKIPKKFRTCPTPFSINSKGLS